MDGRSAGREGATKVAQATTGPPPVLQRPNWCRANRTRGDRSSCWPHQRARRRAAGARPIATPSPSTPGVNVGYGGVGSHHDYPAADIFASPGCGTPLVSPVDGRVLEVRTVDLYDPATDNPAHRGGRYVSILGADGVRYYLAHLDTVAAGLSPGQRVGAGAVGRHHGPHGPGRRLPRPPGHLAAVPGQGVVGPARRRLAAAVPRCLAAGRHGLAGGRGRRVGAREPGGLRGRHARPLRAGRLSRPPAGGRPAAARAARRSVARRRRPRARPS